MGCITQFLRSAKAKRFPCYIFMNKEVEVEIFKRVSRINRLKGYYKTLAKRQKESTKRKGNKG